MNRTRKWLFYTVYIAVAASVFLYVRFPSDAVKDYLYSWVRNSRSGVRIEMARIKPALPPGLNIDSLSLFYKGHAIFSADTAKLIPRYMTVFREQPMARFSADAYGGRIHGNILFAGNSPVTIRKIDAQIDQLKIARIRHFQKKPEDTISGLVRGKITYNALPGPRETTDIKLSISDFTVPLIMKISDLKEIFFNNIELEMAIRSGQLRIRRCRFNGPQTDGRMTGTVTVQAPPGKSLLNLTGTLKPKHLLLAGIANEFSKQVADRGDLPFRIEGTLEAPNFSFR